MPRLNYIVAFYLILIGITGLVGGNAGAAEIMFDRPAVVSPQS
jgi:uncharacterized membrane protein YtjA (UPF0391 family)